MAWSAPGTALLVTLFPDISLNEAIAAYITTAVVLFVIGISGYFDKLLALIPQAVAAGNDGRHSGEFRLWACLVPHTVCP